MAHHYSPLFLTGSLVDSLQGGFDDVSLHPGLGLPLHPYSSFIPAQNFLLKKIFVDVHVIAKKLDWGLLVICASVVMFVNLQSPDDVPRKIISP